MHGPSCTPPNAHIQRLARIPVASAPRSVVKSPVWGRQTAQRQDRRRGTHRASPVKSASPATAARLRPCHSPPSETPLGLPALSLPDVIPKVEPTLPPTRRAALSNFFAILCITTSILSKRSLTSSAMAESSSGHGASGVVVPPKRWMVSTFVLSMLAGSITSRPPGMPTSPSQKLSGESKSKAWTKASQRARGVRPKASTTFAPRFKRAKPIMSSEVLL
mmetsp:Transcript_70217/g.203594  ORF Transcript_70217/g.203594 Transcript_70217/m.203594 type:complete len:220 (-) Transcript_70217:42-701(-)